MVDLDNQHGQLLILDATKDSIISYTVTPQAGEFMEQWFPEVARIVRGSDALVKVMKDAALD